MQYFNQPKDAPLLSLYKKKKRSSTLHRLRDFVIHVASAQFTDVHWPLWLK